MAAAHPEAKAPEISLGDIAKLIQDTSAKIEALGDRVGSLEADRKKGTLTNIRPMDPPEDLSAARKRAFAEAQGTATGEGADGTRKLLMDAHGQRVQPGTILPKFRGDDQVTVRRDVAREGFPKEGDPFPEKFDQDNKGHKRTRQVWRKWHAIFPEATDVFPRAVVWADLLDSVKCPGEGVIKFADYLSKLGMWKYKVYVPGLTRKAGDGFYEYELSA